MINIWNFYSDNFLQYFYTRNSVILLPIHLGELPTLKIKEDYIQDMEKPLELIKYFGIIKLNLEIH